MARSRLRVSASLVGLVLCAPSWAQVTQRVSVATGGAQANDHSHDASISTSGRFVAFWSYATNLVPSDTNGKVDVFVHDRLTGTTECMSVDAGGGVGDDESFLSSISGDGRYVAFASGATNLVPGDTNAMRDVFVRDRESGQTSRISLNSAGEQGNQQSSASSAPSLSADGRFVAFDSFASNLVPGDTNAKVDIFVRDRLNGTTERVSVDSNGVHAEQDSLLPSISADGRFVAFVSGASNLVAGDTNATQDMFVHDRVSHTTTRVSVSSVGTQANGLTSVGVISGDGRYVAFQSSATNFVPDTNGSADVFLHDRLSGTTTRVSVGAGGVQANDGGGPASISSDGRYVAFTSSSGNLVPNDPGTTDDVYLRDLATATTSLVSVDLVGTAAGDSQVSPASISSDGRYVAFMSARDFVVAGDTNLVRDIFVRDRDATGFTSLCDAGIGGVIPCPCSNPPSASGRGCDNSAGTGGAMLTASGVAYLSADSLVFTASGERPTSLSLLAQWIGPNATGVAFGMGVRCTSGTFKRLFSRNAVGGSITVPDFGAGDPTVSARAAARGDTILAGQSRWYVVYYRDPVVLGGCDPWRNFNATQTGQVTWSP